jgi:predicted nucleic acid-binding protein
LIVFIDTSAFLAVLDRDDSNHHRAKKAWAELLIPDNTLICNNYVLVESFALIQHRLGMDAVRVFQDDILPLINIEWVSESMHKSGVSALLAVSRKKVSLVDCISFETMRNLGIKTAFVFDPHFLEQGFKCIP